MSTTEYIVIALDVEHGHQHLKYYKFPLDAGKDFCYRSMVSVNAFAHGCGVRNRNFDKRHGILYVMQRLWPSEMNWIDQTKQTVHLGSVWEFYKAVGYDHRRNRYG